jgi:transcriptional regulatory protein RtcR
MGGGPKRWDRWRPTVALTQQEDLEVHRLELFHGRDAQRLAREVTEDIAHTSPQTEVRLRRLELGDVWDFESVYSVLYEFVRAYPFDTEREDYLVHITTGSHVAQICLFLLTESRHIPGRLLQTSPAGTKPRTPKPAPGPQGAPKLRAQDRNRGEGQPHRNPVGSHSIIDLDLSKYDELAKRFHREHSAGLSVLKSGIATKNAAFNTLIERIEHVAVSGKAPILLLGPTGSGKSHLAKRIFELKKARHLVSGEFAEVNCATLRGDAAMSMLFGHKKGAFTGATTDRPGLLRKADKGLLFLDEVGELGLDEQAMLLRAIEERVFYPMGSDKETSSDFQLIAGTNRDLAAAVAHGTFREDLLARINLWTFRLPSLSARKEDIEPNLDFELDKVSKVLGVQLSMSREARKAFLDFAKQWSWAGNFRDFNAAVVRMATFASGGRISEDLVAGEVARQKESGARSTSDSAEDDTVLAQVLGKEAAKLDRFDRVQLADVVRVCFQAKTASEAGRELFASSRSEKKSINDTDRLKKYLARFGLEFANLRKA